MKKSLSNELQYIAFPHYIHYCHLIMWIFFLKKGKIILLDHLIMVIVQQTGVKKQKGGLCSDKTSFKTAINHLIGNCYFNIRNVLNVTIGILMEIDLVPFWENLFSIILQEWCSTCRNWGWGTCCSLSQSFWKKWLKVSAIVPKVLSKFYLFLKKLWRLLPSPQNFQSCYSLLYRRIHASLIFSW